MTVTEKVTETVKDVLGSSDEPRKQWALYLNPLNYPPMLFQRSTLITLMVVRQGIPRRNVRSSSSLGIPRQLRPPCNSPQSVSI